MNTDVLHLRDNAGLGLSLNRAPGSISGLISHLYGFQGPTLDINTMCSSGLVALDVACNALRAGACDVAIVAAANWVGAENSFRNIGSVNALSKTGILDPLGRVPDGYVRGEAMVTLILQSVQDVEPGGLLRGVVEATGSTHHGSGVATASATSMVSTNAAVLSQHSYMHAYNMCYCKCQSISKADVVYLEMHATGTVGGDKAEIESISNFYVDALQNDKTDDGALSSSLSSSKKLWLGANKLVFGHTEPVSGLLSTAKGLLSFEKGVMPPTLLI